MTSSSMYAKSSSSSCSSSCSNSSGVSILLRVRPGANLFSNRNPMDCSTMQSKLSAGKYLDLNAFVVRGDMLLSVFLLIALSI